MAMSIEERMSQMEQRMQYLEKRVVSQDKALAEKDQQIAELKQSGGSGGGWFQKVEVSGAVEIEASRSSPYTGSSTSDVVVATAAIGVAAQVNDWTSAEISLLYEEDDTPLEVDTATITIADPDAAWFVTSGQQFVPFGSFETGLVSDPLTLEIGETRETAVLGGFDNGMFSAGVYAFNGTNEKTSGNETVDNWGAVFGFTRDGFSAGIGYINDIGDSDGLQDGLTGNTLVDHVPGITANAMAEFGGFTFIAEYTAATDDFQVGELSFNGAGAQPEAFNIEIGTGFTLAGKEASFAIAYQGTDEAIALELPETRIAAAVSVEIYENTALSLEWAHDEDYSTSDSGTGINGAITGTGKKADTVTAQLAVEF
jgi:hypothetical protein